MLQRLRIRDLIRHKGGASNVAALCGVAQPTVSRWAAQGSIPPKYALLLEAIWGIDADLLHNPWSLDKQAWVSEAEQAAVIRGDYDLYLEAPRGAGKPFVVEPVTFEPFTDEDGDEDDSAWIEPVREEKQGWSNDELEAILRGDEP